MDSNIIRLDTKDSATVSASDAEILVTVKGSSFYTGGDAVKRTKEVAELVQKLSEIGVEQSDIAVDRIEGEVESGVLTKSSSARYGLRIRCMDLNLIPEILGVVTSLKSAKLEQTIWRYGLLDHVENDLVSSCLVKSKEQAGLAARALGVRIVGIRECSIKSRRPDQDPEMQSARARDGRRESLTEGIGTSVCHASRVEVEAVVRYLVEGFEG